MYMYYLLNKFSLSTIKMAILDIWIHVRFLFYFDIILNFYSFVMNAFYKSCRFDKSFYDFLKDQQYCCVFLFYSFWLILYF